MPALSPALSANNGLSYVKFPSYVKYFHLLLLLPLWITWKPVKRQITAGRLIIAAVYSSTLLAFRPLAPSHLLSTCQFRRCQSKMAATPPQRHL